MRKTVLRWLVAPLALFALTNCFQILHYLKMNPDGTVSVTWRFSLAAAMRKQVNEKKESGPKAGGDNVAGDLMKSTFEKSDALASMLKQHATDVSVRTIESEYDTTQEVRFSAKWNAPIRGHEGLPIFPTIDAAKKTMVFDFVPLAEKNKKKAGKGGKKGPKKGQDDDEEENSGKKESNPQAEKIAGLFLSTARYQFVLDNVTVTDAYVVNAKTGKKVKITPTALGNLTLVDFPFLSALTMEKDGFRVVIEYR